MSSLFSNIDGLVGTIGASGTQLPDTTPRHPTGTIISAVDPFWGGVELIYGRALSSIRAMGLVTSQVNVIQPPNGFELRLEFFEVAGSSVGIARQLYVALFPMTAGQYGWFVASGTVPVNSIAATSNNNTFGVAATGQAGLVTAGKQVLNAICSASSILTFAKTNSVAAAGSTVLNVPNTEGWFPGIFVTGTGIPANTTVVSIEPSGRQVILSAATTAAVSGTVTGAYTNGTTHYNLMTLNRPALQGQIT